jgi:hypothetical protein
VLVHVQVARAAFWELWRRYGIRALLGAGTVGFFFARGGYGDREALAQACQWGTVFVLVPAVAAAGVSRWVGRGPLGLAGAAGREASTVAGYGLGTALWALPLAVAGAIGSLMGSSIDWVELDVVALGSLLISAAGLGAAAGRLVRGSGSAVMAAWGLVLATALLDAFAGWAVAALTPWAWLPVLEPGVLLGVPAAAAAGAVWLSGKARHATLALGA